MRHTAILSNLRDAERLALSGHPAKAHGLVRECLALGMESWEVKRNLSKPARDAIENHLMSNSVLNAIGAMRPNGAKQ